MAAYRIVCFSNRFTQASQALKVSKRVSRIILLSEGLLALVILPVFLHFVYIKNPSEVSPFCHGYHGLFATEPTDKSNMAIQ